MLNTQFIKNPFTSRFCEQMNVPGTHDRQVAAYLIGTPNPSSITNPGFMAVCFNCAVSIVEKLPDELLKHVDIEKALNLMDEEAKDALFDKLFPPAEPREALEALLGEMERRDIVEALAMNGLIPLGTEAENTTAELMEAIGMPAGPPYRLPGSDPLLEPGMTEQQAGYNPFDVPSIPPSAGPPTFKCPHCDFETKSRAGLSSHVNAKHRRNK